MTEVENAERAVTSLSETPRGVLRVTAGTNTTFLAPIVRDYLKRYPEVRMELHCTGRAVDLVEERFDLAIRAGRLPDSTLIAKSLGNATWLLVATPAYLKRRGRPRSPDDLKEHDCLVFGTGINRTTIHLQRAGETADVDVPARLVVSDIDIVTAVTLGGQGIALLPAYQCVEHVRARRLERVLRDWEAPSTPVQVVYPSTRHLSPKVKSFIDHLYEAMTPPPWEVGPTP